MNSAYQLLASSGNKHATGPDAGRIRLCIKAQSIVYSRCMKGAFLCLSLERLMLIRAQTWSRTSTPATSS